MHELKTTNKCSIFLYLVLVLIFCSCAGKQEYQQSDNYIIVETTTDDDFTTLAEKYLNDPDKGWLIAEFNDVTEIRPGSNVVIPLYPFKRGGVKSSGYQLVPVLCFNQKLPGSNVRGNFAASSFEELLSYLKKNKFQVISLSRLMDFLEYKSQIPKKSVVITVNGAWESFIDIELPLLTKFGYPSTLFIDTETIGKKNFMSWNQLKELSHKGVDIQNGSGLKVEQRVCKGQISLKEYFTAIEKEIAFSKKKIEDEIGGECIYYAFPSGEGNNLLINILKKYGFKAAFNTSGGVNPFYVDGYNINMAVVYPDCTLGVFKDKLVVFQDIDLN